MVPDHLDLVLYDAEWPHGLPALIPTICFNTARSDFDIAEGSYRTHGVGLALHATARRIGRGVFRDAFKRALSDDPHCSMLAYRYIPEDDIFLGAYL